MVCTLKSLAIIADVAVRDNNMGDNMDLVFILNGGIDDFKVDVWVDKFFCIANLVIIRYGRVADAYKN